MKKSSKDGVGLEEEWGRKCSELNLAQVRDSVGYFRDDLSSHRPKVIGLKVLLQNRKAFVGIPQYSFEVSVVIWVAESNRKVFVGFLFPCQFVQYKSVNVRHGLHVCV